MCKVFRDGCCDLFILWILDLFWFGNGKVNEFDWDMMCGLGIDLNII